MKTSKMLDLNIEHLRDQTIPKLEEFAQMELRREQVPIRVLSHHYGFVVYPTDPNSIKAGDLPSELVELNRAAYTSGCILINFDSDAEYLEEFTVFND